MCLEILPLAPTHHSKSTETWIDHIIVSNINKVRNHGQFPVPGISKHDLIYLVYNLKCPKYSPHIIEYRDFSKFDKQAFNIDGLTLPWYLVHEEESLDAKVAIFTNLVTQLYDRHAPLKISRVTRPPAPWLTDEIRNLMKDRDAVHAIFRKTKCELLKKQYKMLRNLVTQKCRNAKIKYYHTTFGRTRDSRTIWKSLKCLGIGKSHPQIDTYISLESLNHSFINNVPSFDSNLKKQSLAFLQNSETIYKDEFFFSSVEHEDVIKIVQSLKSNASGSDGINAKLLKNSLNVIYPIITEIINFSLMSGQYPSSWKTALVHPIPKTASNKNTIEYRPISILPTISKVLEKVVRKQTEQYLQKNHF